MRIRSARVDDLPELLRIEQSCFGSERFDLGMLEDIMSDVRNETFVMEEGVVIGSAMVHHSKGLGRSRIVSIAIVPEERGKGHGRKVLEFLEERAKDHGSNVMELEVRVINVPAIDLYLTSGYELLGTIPNYFGKGEDALYMEKML